MTRYPMRAWWFFVVVAACLWQLLTPRAHGNSLLVPYSAGQSTWTWNIVVAAPQWAGEQLRWGWDVCGYTLYQTAGPEGNPSGNLHVFVDVQIRPVGGDWASVEGVVGAVSTQQLGYASTSGAIVSKPFVPPSGGMYFGGAGPDKEARWRVRFTVNGALFGASDWEEPWSMEKTKVGKFVKLNAANPYVLNTSGGAKIQRCYASVYSVMGGYYGAEYTRVPLAAAPGVDVEPYELIVSSKGDPDVAPEGLRFVIKYENCAYVPGVGGAKGVMIYADGQDVVYDLGACQWTATAAEEPALKPLTLTGGANVPPELRAALMAMREAGSVASGGTPVGVPDVQQPETPEAAAAGATTGDVRETGQAIVDAIKVLDARAQAGFGNALQSDSLTRTSIAALNTGMTTIVGRLDTVVNETRLNGSKIDAVKTSVQANTSTLGGKLDGLGTKLDGVKSAIEGSGSGGSGDGQADRDAAAAATQAGKDQGAAAGENEGGILNGQGGGAPSAPPTIGSGGDYASALKVQFPAAFGGATIDCNPFAHPGLLTVAHWFRSACAWLALVTLGVFVWKDMGEWVRGFSTMRQAQGNAVIGGTGAQATALVAAGLITAAVVVCMTALVSWSFGDISFAAIRSMSVSNPMVGLPTAALGMLSEVLPVSTLVGCAIAKYSFRFYGSSLFATCAAVVRFVVP